jgi:hypothetical protein
MANEYSYTDAGFDGFLSRSIDNTSQNNLDSQGPLSNSIRYDSQQISGAVGDSMRVGNIIIDGVKGRISVYDSGKEVARLGSIDD